MSAYATQLQALHNAMVHKQPEAMLSLMKSARHNEFSLQERLAVYTDGYDTCLIDATIADYPALAHYIGEKECRAAITAFVNATPSFYWDLNRYPLAFANFLKRYSEDKSAHALANLESAIAEVFWLPESKPLTPDSLVGVSEQTFGEMRFYLRNAAKLLRLDYQVNAYLKAFRAGENPKQLKEAPEYLLVIRQDNEVKRAILEPMEYAMLHALSSEVRFSDALSRVKNQEALATKLPHYVARWLQNGFFRELQLDE